MQAVRIIQDEHRSLAAVLHGMLYLARAIRERGMKPPFDVLGAMVYYIDAFPERFTIRRRKAPVQTWCARCLEVGPLLDQLEEELSGWRRSARSSRRSRYTGGI